MGSNTASTYSQVVNHRPRRGGDDAEIENAPTPSIAAWLNNGSGPNPPVPKVAVIWHPPLLQYGSAAVRVLLLVASIDDIFITIIECF
jgi:hypothetical protein